MENFLPFSSPTIGEEEINEVIDTLKSGWLTSGPKLVQFENDFSEFLGGNIQAVAVNSATAGLHLALEALGIGHGDEVITTTYTFTATAEVIRYLGAHPVFVDICPNTLTIDPSLLESVITTKTRAIIPVHFGGMSADMQRILDVASKYNLHVVEDAAHALPTTNNSTLIGKLGSDATIFSFYANKTITTGEGGMLVTTNPDIANRARVMRLHGISKDAFDRYIAKRPSWYYEVIAPGYKYNMTDIQASLGIHQLRKVYVFQKSREKIAKKYDESFRQLPLILPPRPNFEDIHAWHLYLVRLDCDANINRDEFIDAMFERGVGCSVHYIPLHLHPYWRETYNLSSKMYPVSQEVYEKSVSLPIYDKMSDEDIEHVVNAVKSIL